MTTPTQQYDTIQAPYDYIRTASIALIERENVHTALTPYIQSARILELACGTGFYTYSFLDWGASSVVGVDISRIMIESALQIGKGTGHENQVSFLQADCAVPSVYAGAPFDIVFGAWLLNYAADRRGLVDMFRNVAGNLREGGRFVGVTVPPAERPKEAVVGEADIRPLSEGGSGYLVYECMEDVEEGVKFRVRGETPGGNFAFECFHLEKRVYEEAAREAGLMGRLEWGVTKVPERWLRGEGRGVQG
ncbi:hypothetical protein SBOR_8366 [Sclerotinia borealis F-4128]|uniref:Methyltransferase domain-containing protein n=1 Tax=Sclerotinia borealis (strain F-4128) TaxID=1432307 RepID=W9C8R2_SCLBF|nr:hypothetical protein SBOR_8366 [Sclerotinia borealis F-4128]